ncbi:MAG: glutathione S-transferase family protein [Thermoleophilaceae bacterium]
MIRLYHAAFSTNSERVRLALAYKGLEAESVLIEYSDRTLVQQVSGQGLVPVLEEDGVVVHDSHAILRHLEERHPDAPLFPPGPAQQAELDVFLEWFDHVWKIAPNAIEAELGNTPPDAGRIEELSGDMQRHLDLFEQLLTGRDHLLGDSLTAADLVAFPFLKYARPDEAEDDELFHVVLDEHQSLGGRPRLAAWIERVDALPRA